MAELTIAIPSYKRADKLVGYEYFKDAKIVIPESQKDDYLKYCDTKRLVVVPDSEDGDIVKKRNWILKNMGRPLLMIDDDVSCLKTPEKRNRKKLKVIKLSPEQAEVVIRNGFNMAHEWGAVLWGLNVNYDPLSYHQYHPFGMCKVVLGPFAGHLNHDLFFDHRMQTTEDYDFCLQVLHKYKKILRFNKYAPSSVHGDNAGGVVSWRTKELEIRCCKAVMKKWGKKIIKYRIPPLKRTDLLNADVHIPIKGV